MQLGFLDDAELAKRWTASPKVRLTDKAISGKTALLARTRSDHAQGYSIVDEELEKGLRSIAVPIVTRAGEAVGAINLSAHSSRTTRTDLRDRFLPKLDAVARTISRTLI